MIAVKRCVDCKLSKPIGEFYRAKNYRGGYHTCCKPCFHIRNRRSAIKHYEKRLAAARLYRKENAEKLRQYAQCYKREKLASMSPDEYKSWKSKRKDEIRAHRAKKYGNGGRHSEAQWQTLLDLCGRKCLACGTTKDLSRDHIVPLTRGGDDSIENIQPLCRSCNSKKNRYRTTDYRKGVDLTALPLFTETRICLVCRLSFETSHWAKKYCSRKCASVVYRSNLVKKRQNQLQNY